MSRFAEVLTPRLKLTAVAMDDLEEFHALHSDPALFRHAPEVQHPDREHSESVIGLFVDDWSRWDLGYWSVRDLHTGVYLGCGGVRRNEVNWNAYYRFHRAAWGHGYAVEVVQAAAACAEMIEPGALLQAVMRPSNPASRRVAERLGMVFCGTQPDHAGIDDLVYQQFARELS
jgi:RimJ/RimL family protein N-acetyltransferase